VRKGSERPRKSPCASSGGVNGVGSRSSGAHVTEEGRSKREPVAKTKVKSKRKRFSKRPPDGPFGANAAWIHGGCGTPEYSAYTAAKTLCANPKNPRWGQYGERGIEFRFSSFPSFLEHLGCRPTGKVLDRIDRDGHFAPGNVYWRRKRPKKRRTPKAKARKAARIAVEKTPRVKPVNVCGHPDRPHYAFGLCDACYRISPERRAVRRRYNDSPKGKETRARYAASPQNRAGQGAYAATRYVPRARPPASPTHNADIPER
jgi:hypothetical protein